MHVPHFGTSSEIASRYKSDSLFLFLSFAYIRQQPCPFANYYIIGDLQFTEISVFTHTEIASVLDMLG
jgi:hypothetical protein